MFNKIIILFILSTNLLLSQKEANNWYFGKHTGITFNKSDSCPNPPCPIKKSMIETMEGCSSISDKSGNLLFYTDGITVWNKNHKVMTGGSDLAGHSSSTQSALIFPKPTDSSIYYIFTADGIYYPDYYGSKGINYSAVDMSLDNGNGAVTKKNIQLVKESTEKLAATYHNNCRDIWLVTHSWNSNEFLSYLITDTGIVLQPVISAAGSFLTNNNMGGFLGQDDKLGYLKISSDGSKIANALYGSGKFEVFIFDNKTGIVSEPFFSDSNIKKCYGLEFAKSGRILYVSNREAIYQYHLDSISRSGRGKVIYSYTLPSTFSAIQMGPDEKIYFSSLNYVGIIEYPEILDEKSGFNRFFLKLSDNPDEVTSAWGLPNFLSSLFIQSKIKLPYLIEEIGIIKKIPLIMTTNCPFPDSLNNFQFISEIEFDATFFSPHNYSLIKENKVINDQRILTLEGEFWHKTQETVIAEIPGLVLLGKKTKTPLKINKFEILNSNIKVELQDGSLEIYGVCEPGMSQIKLFEPLKVDIMPNPVEDILKFCFHPLIFNEVNISISNFLGCYVREFIINNNEFQNNNEVEINVSDFASGLYFATIRTGGQFQTVKFVILR